MEALVVCSILTCSNFKKQQQPEIALKNKTVFWKPSAFVPKRAKEAEGGAS